MKLTQERLRTLLSYDERTGIFRWLVNRQRARKGDIAGCLCPMYGYNLIGIDYRHYRAARLAWLYMTGSWPTDLIDHIDRNRANDAWDNLRLATAKQNNQNRSVSKDSLSGISGVSWQPSRKKWMAHITNDGKTKNLGRFSKLDDAISARKLAESAIFTHVSA